MRDAKQAGREVGLVTNGRDAADRIRAEGWRAEFATRREARKQAAQTSKSDRLRPLVVEMGRGLERFNEILETLGRLEHTDGLEFADLVWETAPRIRRDATVVAFLREVTPLTAAALGDLVRRGFLVTAIMVFFGGADIPDWAQPPEWAEMLLGQGVDFRLINSEEAITNLCAEAIVR